jgi:methylated-DNA-[protein]-cysteine S-methyltransferase
METERAHHCVFDSAIGPCGVAWSARGLIAVQLPEADRVATEKRLPHERAAPAQPRPRPGWRR